MGEVKVTKADREAALRLRFGYTPSGWDHWLETGENAHPYPRLDDYAHGIAVVREEALAKARAAWLAYNTKGIFQTAEEKAAHLAALNEALGVK